MLVDSGLGIAFAIEGAVSLYKNSNIVFVPFSPAHFVTSVVVWKKHQPFSQAATKFIEYIKEKLTIM